MVWGLWPFCCGLRSPVSGLQSRRGGLLHFGAGFSQRGRSSFCPSVLAFGLGSGRGLKPVAGGLEPCHFGRCSQVFGLRSSVFGGLRSPVCCGLRSPVSGLQSRRGGLPHLGPGRSHFGRSSRGLEPGAWGPEPLFLNSKRLSLLFWFSRFLASLYGCRGSRWVPPGRQLRSRACRSASAERCLNAAVASAGEAHSFPRANHRISASGCFWRSRLKVGSISSRSAARNAVGRPPTRIVQ